MDDLDLRTVDPNSDDIRTFICSDCGEALRITNRNIALLIQEADRRFNEGGATMQMDAINRLGIDLTGPITADDVTRVVDTFIPDEEQE